MSAPKRGRPPSPDAKLRADILRAHRDRIAAAGGALKQVRLSAEALAALAAIRAATGETDSAVVERLLIGSTPP